MKRFILIVVFFPLIVDAQTAKEYFEQGKQQLDSAKYQDADLSFTKAITLKLNYASAYYFRAIAEKNEGYYSRAILDFTRVINLKPNETRGYYQRALAREKLLYFSSAAADYKAIINLEPDSAGMYREKAMIDSSKTLPVSEYATAANMDSKVLYLQRAEIDRNNSDYKGCVAEYTALIELDPKNINAYANRASAKTYLNDNKGAIADYEAAAKLDDRYRWTYYNIIGNLQSGTDDKGAISYYDKSIALYPSEGTFANRGNVWTRLGKYKRAIRDYTKAIDLQNVDTTKYRQNSWVRANHYTARGKAEALNGDFKAALADFNTSIRLKPLNPTDAWTYNARGEARNQLGDKAGACTDWQMAFKLGNKDAGDNLQKFCR